MTIREVSPVEAARAVEFGSIRTPEELSLTLIIVAFAAAALAFLAFLTFRRATPFLLRCYIITIIVFGSLLVVSSSFGTDQIAPILGLFGTIAGYVLGRAESKPGAPDASAP